MDNIAQRTILLVEDELILGMVTKQQLENEGYRVLIVKSGEKAIDMLRENDSIDLILMDIELGKGLDGTKAAEIILQSHDIPLVFLSSHTEKDIVEKTEKIINYGYVIKNSSFTVLEASIKTAFNLFDAYTIMKEHEHAYQSPFTEMVEAYALHEIICDTNGVAIDYRYLDINPAFEKMTNLKRTEILGKTSKELFPRTESNWVERFGKVALGGKPILFEDYSVEQNKSYRVAVFCPKKGQFAVIFTETTEEKKKIL